MTREIVYPLPSNVTEREPHLTGPTWEKWLVPEPAGRAEDLGLDLKATACSFENPENDGWIILQSLIRTAVLYQPR